MALTLQEQEELENAKRAWRLWGRWVFFALLALAVVYWGNQIWRNYQNTQNNKALDAYNAQFVPPFQAQNLSGSADALATLQKDFPQATVTTEAALAMAGTYFASAQYDQAATTLQWIVSHQKDEILQTLAVQRLATVYLQQQKYDEAINILKTKTAPEFAMQLDDLRGDIYLASGKTEEAKQSFERALKAMDQNHPHYTYVQAKLNYTMQMK